MRENGLSAWYQFISQELKDGISTTKFAWISLGKDREFIMFDDMHCIFKVTCHDYNYNNRMD